MENNTRKYILIPEHRPLWAMRKCFGPTHGPLTKPCPTSMDIIRELLLQDGREALTIMEVIKVGDGYSEPVRLTLDNYTLSYEEIRGGKVTPPMELAAEPEPEKVEVEPTFKPDPEPPAAVEEAPIPEEPAPVVEPEPAASPVVVIEEEDRDEIPAQEEPAAVSEEAVETSTEDEASTAEEKDPYAGMTRSQRRAARKAAEAEAAKVDENK